MSDILSVILPACCHICGRPLPRTRQYICGGCLADLPVASYDLRRNPMTDALTLIPEGIDGTAFMRYNIDNACAALIHDFKYRGYSRLARTLGREAAAALSDSGFFNSVDKIIPVPLHRSKLRKRGYNQALEIARGLGDFTGIPVERNLVATRSHGTQTRLSRTARQKNVEGVFAVRHPEQLEGCTLLIVDDVFTTGATLLSAAKEISGRCRGVKIKIFALATAHR